ncbi:MAG: NAD(+)/NADH kinase [Candidatus Pseudothioglobus sp.]|jgi:NAD+ kinase
MFNTIGIICKPNDFTSQKTAWELGVFIKDKGVTLLEDGDDIKKDADLIVVVGGDGTILNTARTYVDSNIPILGVNLGRLGFLADVPVESMIPIVSGILKGEYIKEKRSLLSCQIERNGKLISQHLALNEVVVHRNETPRMIEFELFVDDDFVNNQRADGIIVTTPTGSTAYALSSGGPIMHPSTNAICLVSISPHTMSHRPFILHGESEVLITLLDCEDRATISFDAQSAVSVSVGDDLRVKQHDNFVHLIHPKGYDYFEIIRSKLHWGQKV